MTETDYAVRYVITHRRKEPQQKLAEYAPDLATRLGIRALEVWLAKCCPGHFDLHLLLEEDELC